MTLAKFELLRFVFGLVESGVFRKLKALIRSVKLVFAPNAADDLRRASRLGAGPTSIEISRLRDRMLVGARRLQRSVVRECLVLSNPAKLQWSARPPGLAGAPVRAQFDATASRISARGQLLRTLGRRSTDDTADRVGYSPRLSSSFRTRNASSAESPCLDSCV